MITIKKIILTVICFIFLLCGCSDADTVSSPPITVKMPKDNTVNGYRNKSTVSSSSAVISQNDNDQYILYYANTNSKTFHFSSCKSAQKILNKNLYITEFRDELTEQGYSPCSICNP